MKLAMSQIAWAPEDEPRALALLQRLGFAGLEIAPTRVAGNTPYSNIEAGAAFSRQVLAQYGLTLCSMQSIWFGQQGNMFGSQRQHLLQYTKAAVDFAAAAGIANMVFGSPKNRNLPQGKHPADAVDFFAELGAYATKNGCVLALEANPPVYGTNFLNTTGQALAMVDMVNSPGCLLNLDFGTIVINSEDVADLQGAVPRIHHVHISEPGLALLRPRPQHRQLAKLLRQEGYSGYVSVEMKGQPLSNVEQAAAYLVEVFG